MAKFAGFSQVELRKPKRSLFDLSHEKCLTTRMGRITPYFCEETLPGDTFKLSTRMIVRLAPLLAPVMHSFTVRLEVFKVPIRLLWKDSELFFTGGRLGTETPPVPPNTLISTIQGRAQQYLQTSKLSDYLGLNPIDDSANYSGRTIDLLPFAATYSVWYNYYRDRNFVADDADNDPLPLASGTTANTAWIDKLCATRLRDWAPDYFTTALPWTQRGAQVLMPLIGSGSVTYLNQTLVTQSDGGNVVAGNVVTGAGASSPLYNVASPEALKVQNIDEVNLTSSSVSINDFRRAERLQEYLERNALAGSRYFEWTLAHFAIRGSDARLQRPEYVGGRKVPLNVNEVVSTAWAQDGDAAPVAQGNMAGHSKTFGETERLRFFCEEHCFVVGFLCIMPVAKYMQGSRRYFFGRNTSFDYGVPLLANIGEQPVYKYEVYTDPTTIPVDRTTQPIFGYQSRYSDWKNTPSTSHGAFRTTLSFWTMTRQFGAAPSLSTTFLTFDDELQDQCFVVDGEDNCWIYLYNECYVTRALPYFGTPTL